MADTIETQLIVEAIAKGFDQLKSKLDDTGKAGTAAEKGISTLDKAVTKLATAGYAALVAGGTAAVKVLYESVQAAAEAEQIQAKVNTVLESTGGIAGQTAESIDNLATKYSRLTTYEDDAIKSSAALLLTFTNVRGEVFDPATEAILNMSAALGQDLQASTIQVGKALNDPIAGVTALRKVGVQLSDQQEDMIRSFMEVNDIAGAQGVILGELSTQFGGQAAAAAATFQGRLLQLQNQAGELKEELGNALLPVLTDLAEEVLPIARRATEDLAEVTKESLTPAIRDLYNTLSALKSLTSAGGIFDWALAANRVAADLDLRILQLGTSLVHLDMFMNGNREEAAELAQAMTDINLAAVSTAEKVERYRQVLALAERQLHGVTDASGELFIGTKKIEAVISPIAEMFQDAADAVGDYGEATLSTKRKVEGLSTAQEEVIDNTGRYFEAAMNAGRGVSFYNERLEALGRQYVTVGGRTQQQSQDLTDIRGAYERVTDQLHDYQIGLAGAGLSEEARAEKMAELGSEAARLHGLMQPLIDITGTLSERNVVATINQEAVNQALYNSAVAAGASAERLAILGGALGIYSAAAVEAALRSAAIQVEIDRLAVLYATGKLKVDEYRDSVYNFIAGLDGVAQSAGPMAAALDTGPTRAMRALGEEADTTKGKLEGIPKEVNVHIGVTHDPFPSFPSYPGGSNPLGNPGVTAALGADFVVPPGYPNDSFPMRVQSGEHVTVTPAGQTGGNSGAAGVTIQNLTIHAETEAGGRAAAHGLYAELARLTRVQTQSGYGHIGQ